MNVGYICNLVSLDGWGGSTPSRQPERLPRVPIGIPGDHEPKDEDRQAPPPRRFVDRLGADEIRFHGWDGDSRLSILPLKPGEKPAKPKQPWKPAPKKKRHP